MPGEVSAFFTLSHNVESEEAVRAVVDEMVRAGARVLKAPKSAEWGGYHGTVVDPAGACWEIAYNPGWSVADDGTVTIGPG